MIVLDASVVLKWIFGDEDRGEKAKLFRENHASGKDTIAVHNLFFYEIANVISTKTTLSYKDASDAFSLIWAFDLDVFDFGRNEYLSSIRLSKLYGITLYDASYIELAHRLKCRFITADRKLHQKVRGIGGIELL
jgi:predicted nucleic acid-binding protein